jgi:hypothetical protein
MFDDALGSMAARNPGPGGSRVRNFGGEMTANERMNLGGEIAVAAEEASGGRTMRNARTINQREDETYRQTRPGRCASGRLSAHSQQQSWVPTYPMAGSSGSSCSQFSRAAASSPSPFFYEDPPSPSDVVVVLEPLPPGDPAGIDESRSFAPGTPPPQLPPGPEMLFSWLLPGMRCDDPTAA